MVKICAIFGHNDITLYKDWIYSWKQHKTRWNSKSNYEIEFTWKGEKYNYLLYNIRVLLSRLESLKKYYDKCNNKLGMLNREIAQLEFKLLKNDKEREF